MKNFGGALSRRSYQSRLTLLIVQRATWTKS